jgi:hypothetical protein
VDQLIRTKRKGFRRLEPSTAAKAAKAATEPVAA